MEKFITKKRKLSNNDQSAVAVAESESTISNGTFEKKKKNRLYCDRYLNIGFTCCGCTTCGCTYLLWLYHYLLLVVMLYL